ncbi:MAG: T9SS type A sorting domain-containing protein [Fibrobacter sp.]|nr:T9SS type A sorting domain-containing protein [Fibrobacter sp.]
MKKLCILLALIVPVTLFSAPKYPFPQNVKYPYGIQPSSINSDVLQSFYQKWLQSYYEESGDRARIKFDTPSFTVSEGIGYGMLIMVYMDNATNNTQAKFDKLWKYYNSFLNNNGLMHWKINGFSNVASDGRNAATDAEVDVAVALIEAYKQWGDEKYLNDAKAIVQKIYQFEVNANGYLKPGDSWDTKKNPSYFSTAALELFKKVGSQDWDRVKNNSYNLLKKCANATTGLVPDWCGEDGSPQGSYYYDATRTPWRIGWGYVWYGHSEAKSFCSKLASWITTKTGGKASAIIDGYELDGRNKGQGPTSAFVGAFACAGLVDATHQEWLDSTYAFQVSLINKDESYFNSTLKLIYLLLLSGNMPDFWTTQPQPEKFTCTVTVQPQASGTVTISPSGTSFKSGTEITLTAKGTQNYKFVNWNGDINGTDSVKKITITKNLNVSAVFEQRTAVYNNSLHNSNSKIPSISTAMFNDNQSIYVNLPQAGDVKVGIFDLAGKTIVNTQNTFQPAGTSFIRVDRALPYGTYLVKLESDFGSITEELNVNKSW